MKKLIVFISAVLMLFVHSSANGYSASVDSIVYNKDKSITVYGTYNGNSDDFGICIGFDEKRADFTDSVKYKAYSGTDDKGRFGIVIPYSDFASDCIFALKVYASETGGIIYSENTLVADAETTHSRIPLLTNATPSEGEIYPPLSKEISEYYVLVDKIPEKPLSIKYELDNKEDSVTYTEGADISDTVTIKLSSGFEENVYTFSYRLRKKAELTPEKYYTKLTGSHLNTAGSFDFTNSKVNYIIADSSLLPEKYVPTKVLCNIRGTAGKSLSVAACTEPFIETNNWTNVNVSYAPQTEEFRKIKLTSGENLLTMNEKEFKTRSSLKLALKGDSGIVISEFKLLLEYFEDFNLPVYDKNSVEPKAASLSVSGANEIYPEFSKDVFEYYAIFDKLPSSVPDVKITAENSSSSVKITPASDINKETSVEISLGGKTNTYKVKFREYKEADMKLNALAAKRSPYELYTAKVPATSTSTPYHGDVGKLENEYGTGYSHLTVMGFDTAEVEKTDIHISSAELTLFATTNCSEGSYVDIYRCTNTSWTSGKEGRTFFATANHFAPKGSEGKLNGDTLIKYTGGKTASSHFHYYTIPLNTVGFTNAESVNLYYLNRWQFENPPASSYQTAYVWIGMNGSETVNGIGAIPTVKIKYFTK